MDNLAEQVLSNSHSGIIVLDSEQKITVWNKWIADYSRITAEDACGQYFEDLFPNEKIVRLMMAIKGALTQKQSSVLSHSINATPLPIFPPADEGNTTQRLPHSIVVKPIVTSNDTRYCLIEISNIQGAQKREGLLREQSLSLKKLAAKAEQQEAHARAIIENIHDALLTIDTEGNLITLNSAADTLFEYSDEELPDKNIYDLFINIKDLAELQQQSAIKDTYIGIKKSGEHFPAEVGISTVESKYEVHHVLIVRDLTFRKQAEENLFREKEFAQTTLHAIDEAVITTDEKGIINSLNLAASRLLQKSSESLISRPLLNILTFDTLDDRRNIRTMVEQAIHDGINTEITHSPLLTLHNNESFYINGQISSLKAADGHAIGCVIVMKDISLEKRMNEMLTHQATHDELTNLINRREFERRLEDLLIRANTDKTQSVLLYLDLDQFKLINDNCGHDAGDQLLKQITSLLSTQLRQTDTLARLGGDEFAVLLPGCSLEVSSRIAEKLREIVSEYRFNWEERNYAIGVSVGLVQVDDSYQDVATVMKAADSSCYIAKEAGRNQVVVYKEDGDEEQRRRSEMNQATRITESLENNRFRIFCQPIVPVNMYKDSSWGIEVLIRMFDEDQNMVPPMAFIPAAERYNMMSHIDRWVVDEVCRQWIANPDIFNRLDKCAINLSGQSMANDDFLEYVIKTIEENKLPWNKICFEITETAAVASIEKAQNFMANLSKRGCRFALDDFGSGLSSFTYLKHLAVDYLKIDGAFVKDMLTDKIDAAMVRSISDIGRAMNLETIAEFVENTDIIDALRDANVNWAQGYGICKPMPIDELALFTPVVNSETTKEAC